jgi:hypothetical protein
MLLTIDTLSTLTRERDFPRRCAAAADTVADALNRSARDGTRTVDIDEQSAALAIVGAAFDLAPPTILGRASRQWLHTFAHFRPSYHAEGYLGREHDPIAVHVDAAIGLADMLGRIDGTRRIFVPCPDIGAPLPLPMLAAIATLPHNALLDSRSVASAYRDPSDPIGRALASILRARLASH